MDLLKSFNFVSLWHKSMPRTYKFAEYILEKFPKEKTSNESIMLIQLKQLYVLYL